MQSSSSPYKPSHSRSGSLCKRPISPPSGEVADTSITKRSRTFHAESGSRSSFSEPNNLSPVVLPVCVVCLGCQRHNMPVICCPAKRTWDDQFDTICKRINKVLCLRDRGKLLCSQWKRDKGCCEKHNNMHACSGCKALMHGASRWPHAQRAPPTNSL
ncbi:hypothetical protein PAXRUDRAFT_169314 [Paxillus rubicundulus Ve08.2h10]|uniref:Uncharacterized protein n=1 Tax=Paxillus rubicundulus Ve08.2h10 TaxID=930991 RepID=A0A0D0CMU3_9AGAM|nr:hypothetical protein PAXRUDRAFT_169314 [Paxillus rubicundulus Ve08.2h10]